MRLFLQLPFGSPIMATPGCRALADCQPDVRLAASAAELAAALTELRALNFDDGRRAHRWQLAQTATWEHRAATVHRLLQPLLDVASPAA
jgi:hypothetical protein